MSSRRSGVGVLVLPALVALVGLVAAAATLDTPGDSTRRTWARGDLNPHVLADTGT